MSISSVLPYVQIILSLLLMAGILLQRSEASLGSAFGADAFGSTNFERRGSEKFLFRLTVVIGILFALTSLLGLFLK